MSHWEFLLQKEGDQTWLPLESADVEILEGRYRIVANTHIANTEVQIRIIHDSTEETPPVRRVHRRSSHTRSQGLMSIIPFTHLKPGKWELCCFAKLSTSSQEVKQHIVHLQVLPTEYDSSDFSQQLESDNQEISIVKDSQADLKDVIFNENISFFSGEIDINEVTINQGENVVKNNPELSKREIIKSEEIGLLDAQTQEPSQLLSEESERMENITDFLDSGEQKKVNTQSKNEESKNIENQFKELTKTPINNLSTLGEIQQKVELDLNKETDADTNTITTSTVNFPLELILDQESYIAKPGEGLIISGEITIDSQNQNIQSNEGLNNQPLQNQNNLINEDSAITENNALIINGSLKICLRNPQNSEILIEVQQTLPEQVAPIIFAGRINIPENIKTHLILGQITVTDHKDILANKSFTITAPLESWLAAVDDDFVKDEHQEMVPPQTSLTARKPEPEVNSFQKLVETINQSQLEQKIDKEQPLPLQVCGSITGESDSHNLTLPTFGNPLPENMAKNADQINDLLSKSNAPRDSELLKLPTFGSPVSEKVAKNANEINDLSAKSNTPDDLDEVDDVWGESEFSEGEASLPQEEESDLESLKDNEASQTRPNLVSFPTKFDLKNKELQALKLEDRFFSKAYSLINDSELLQWMRASSLEPSEETEKDEELESILKSKENKVEELEDNDSISVIVDDEEFASDNDDQVNWEEQEFVVEDEQLEEVLPDQEEEWNFGLAHIDQEQDESISIQSYILPEEQLLPVPYLEVLAKDIIAGRSVKVRVKLPEGLPRIYVKIWVYDRQAQAIVAGPRWLTDFIPNGMGEIEAITELEIVYGCLEVRFEAIAAEVQTNRESHKAVLEYLVAPPPPPELPFDYL